MFEGANGNGVSVGTTDAAETRKAVNETSVLDDGASVKRERYYHRPQDCPLPGAKPLQPIGLRLPVPLELWVRCQSAPDLALHRDWMAYKISP
jgi:hypothetical protein